MSSSDIQTISEAIALHPPLAIGCLCVFMYIRSRFLQDKSPEHASIDNDSD